MSNVVIFFCWVDVDDDDDDDEKMQIGDLWVIYHLYWLLRR